MKSVFFFFTVYFLLPTTDCFSQVSFHKKYSVASNNIGIGYSVKQTTDGGLVIVGVNADITSNVYLQKTDSLGNLLWKKQFTAPGEEAGHSLEQTTDGGFIIAGHTTSFGAGLEDMYLLKTNSVGNLVWARTFGTARDDGVYSVQQTNDGGFILTGYGGVYLDSMPNISRRYIYLVKTDSNGNLIWSKGFGDSLLLCEGYSVDQTADGGFIIAGRSFWANNTDALLLKTDSAGNFLWAKTYGGTWGENAFCVQQTTDGGFIVTGMHQQTTSDYTVYLFKTDSLGNLLWETNFRTTMPGFGYNEGLSVQQTPDGGYIVTGRTGGSPINPPGGDDVYLLKTDSTGNLLWSNTFGTNVEQDAAFSLDQTNDGGFILTGFTNSTSGIPSIYLIKTDSVGNTICSDLTQTTFVFPFTTIVTSIILPDTLMGVMNAATPLTDTVATQTNICSTAGVSENNSEQDNIFIFPNPSAGHFNINYSISDDSEFVLQDELGRVVLRLAIQEENKKNQTVDVSLLPEGIYFWSVFSVGSRLRSGKLIVIE